MKVEDGMIFIYPDDNDSVILNYYTYCEVVKGAIIKYAKLSLEEATKKIEDSFLYKHLPTSYKDVEFLTHEYEYHWAMTIVYGFQYWMKGNGISSNLPEDYFEWEKNFIKEKNLSERTYQYI